MGRSKQTKELTLLPSSMVQEEVVKDRPIIPTEKPTVSLEDMSSGMQRYTFGWMNPLIKKAIRQKNLTPNDLHPPHPSMQSINCGRTFAYEWNMKRWQFMEKKKDELPVVLPTIYKSFTKPYKTGLYLLFPLLFITSMVAPFMIEFLINVVEREGNKIDGEELKFTDSSIFGFILCAVLFITEFAYCFLDTYIMTAAYKIGTQGFQALQDVLYLKMMKIKANNTQIRDVTNLLFTDSFRIQEVLQSLPALLLFALQCITVIIYLAVVIKIYSLIGIGILCVFLPIIIVVGNKNVTVQRVLMGYRDNRMSKVQEVLEGMKMIKYFRTELVTEQKLSNIRKKELKILRKYGMVIIGINILSNVSSIIMNAVTFSIIWKFGTKTIEFKASNIYTVIYLYEFINNIMLEMPIMFSSLLESNVCGQRIRAFLSMPEIDIGCVIFTQRQNVFGADETQVNEDGTEIIQSDAIFTSSKKNSNEDEDEDNEEEAGDEGPDMNYIFHIENVPSFTYAISEDLVIPPVLDTDFALHRDKIERIIRSYEAYLDMYNNAYEAFMDIYNADQKSEAFQAIKADVEVLRRGPCFDYFRNVDNNGLKIVRGDHLTFFERRKRGELERAKFKRISHELIATLLDNWCMELDMIPISKIENLSLYDEQKLTRRFEFDSDLDFLRRMYINLRICTPYYQRFKLKIIQALDDLQCSIRDLELKVTPGEIIGICGSVGSGKSTLFEAIIGELRLERIQRKGLKQSDQILRYYDKGTYDFVDPHFDLTTLVKIEDKKFKIDTTVKKKDDDSSSSSVESEAEEDIPIPKVYMNAKRIAYYTESPIIFAGTIKHNIVFYQEYDEVKYRTICALCSLLTDFDEWPEGDAFRVGYDGTGLSGGQKARVALARALYFDPDLLLLDDPLAAVDAFVAKCLWQNLICGYCRFKGITVMIATHQTQFFGDCDRVLYLENGIILFDGTVEELENFTGNTANVGEEWSEVGGSTEQQPLEDKNSLVIKKRKQPLETFNIEDFNNFEIKSVPAKEDEDTRIMMAPARRAKFDSYKKYFKYGSGCGTISFIIMLLLQFFGKVILSLFIAFWTQDILKFFVDNKGDYYMYIYIGLSGGTLLLNFFSLFTFMVVAINSAKNMYEEMTRSIIRTKLAFFDTTSNGTIINKFSKDTEAIDVSIMKQLIEVFVNVSGIITLLEIMAINWLSAVVIIPVLCFYFYYFNTFRIVTPALKKIDGVLKGPIISQSNETMRSLPLIRSIEYEDVFCKVYRNKNDTNVQAMWPSQCGIRWLTFRMNIIGCFVSTGVCIAAILSVGLMNIEFLTQFASVSISQSFSLIEPLIQLILSFVQVEAEGVSIENVLEYVNLPREGRYKSEREVPADWPKKGGSIEIKNLFFRYRSELPQVLKGLNFNIAPFEHIGIAGRTGCSKSTLTMALFRVNEPDEGSKIIFDGINILDDIGLHASRKGLAIVPQDPFIFSGTLRTALDKASELEVEGLTSDEYEKMSDAYLWETLDRVNLGQYFRKQPGGLDTKIFANASNLSLGQKQLIIFASTLIAKAFTVIMDEATSMVDKATDELVQQIVREQLNDRIILSIAHRLDTIISFDKILVLDSGELVEFDTAANLLRGGGHFFELAKSTGKDNFKRLKGMALEKERMTFPDLPPQDGIDEDWVDINAVKEMHDVEEQRQAAKEEAEQARQRLENAFGEDNDDEEVDMLGGDEEEEEGENEEEEGANDENKSAEEEPVDE